MLKTVEAEIDIGGNVRLLEPIEVLKTTRALVTVLNETENRDKAEQENSKAILEFLRNNRLPESSRRTAEEIEAQIEENRNSWD